MNYRDEGDTDSSSDSLDTLKNFLAPYGTRAELFPTAFRRRRHHSAIFHRKRPIVN